MKIKERYFAKKKLVKALKEQLYNASPAFAALLDGSSRVEVAKTEEGVTLFLINGEPKVFEVEGEYFPTLKGVLEAGVDRRYVVVDSGAVPHVINGADIMRPGVVDFDPEIEPGMLIVVLEERHRKPIAIGRALWSGREFQEKDRGKCVKNIHHVGDRIWKLKI